MTTKQTHCIHNFVIPSNNKIIFFSANVQILLHWTEICVNIIQFLYVLKRKLVQLHIWAINKKEKKRSELCKMLLARFKHSLIQN